MAHECHMCGAVADSHQALRTHMWTHLKGSSYLCMKCGAKYPKAAELVEHIAVEHGEPVHGVRDEDDALDMDVVEDRAGEEGAVLDVEGVVDRVLDAVEDRAGDRVLERAEDGGGGRPEEGSETGAVPVEAQAANVPLVDLTLDEEELADSLVHLPVKTPPPSPPPAQPAQPPPTPPRPVPPCPAVDPPQSSTGPHPHVRDWVRDSIELPPPTTEDTDVVRQDADSTVPDKDPVSDAPLRKRCGPRRRRPRASARSSVEGAAESTSGAALDAVPGDGRPCQQTAPDDAAPAPAAELGPASAAILDEAAMTLLGMSLKDLPRSVVAPMRGRRRRVRHQRPAASAADVAVRATKRRPASRPRFAAKSTKHLAGASVPTAAVAEGPALLVADAEGAATPPADGAGDLSPPTPAPALAEAVVEPKKKRPASRGTRPPTAPKRGPKCRLALAEAETASTASLPMPVAEEAVHLHGVAAVATAEPVLAEAEATCRPGPKRARGDTKKRPRPVASGPAAALIEGSAPDARPAVRRGRGRPKKASLKVVRHRITMSVCDQEQEPLGVGTVARPSTPLPPAPLPLRWVDQLVRRHTTEGEGGWKCYLCPSVFAKGQEQSCERHVMVHLGFSDCTCPGCGMAYPSPAEREDHQRRSANTLGTCTPR